MASPDPDKELNGFLKKAMKKKHFFGMVVKGKEGRLIVSKKKVKKAELKQIKKEMGGKIVSGECVGEKGGKMVFYSKEKVPAGAEKLAKILAKKAKVPIKPEFKVGAAPG